MYISKSGTMLCMVVLIATAVSTISPISRRQTDSKTALRSELIKQLKSDNWKERADAFYKLRSIDSSGRDKEKENALLNQLDEENQVITTTIRESGGKNGVSHKYGEEYSQYYADLAEAAAARADYSDKRTLSVLVNCAYNPESVFAQKLLNRGEDIVQPLFEMLNDEFSGKRWTSVEMLAQLATKYRSKITDSGLEKIKQKLTQRLNDESKLVRLRTTHALQKINSQ